MIRAKKLELNFDIGISLADDIDRGKKRFVNHVMTPCMYLLKWFFYSFFFKRSSFNGYDVVVKKWSTNRGKLNKLTQRWTN